MMWLNRSTLASWIYKYTNVQEQINTGPYTHTAYVWVCILMHINTCTYNMYLQIRMHCMSACIRMATVI